MRVNLLNFFDRRPLSTSKQVLYCTVLYCTVLYCTAHPAGRPAPPRPLCLHEVHEVRPGEGGELAELVVLQSVQWTLRILFSTFKFYDQYSRVFFSFVPTNNIQYSPHEREYEQEKIICSCYVKIGKDFPARPLESNIFFNILNAILSAFKDLSINF